MHLILVGIVKEFIEILEFQMIEVSSKNIKK